MLFSEFRDGNAPAGYDLLRPFTQALELVPEGVGKVYMRSDTAGYVMDLLRYCAEGKYKRFGAIELAVGADMMAASKQAVLEMGEAHWITLYRYRDGERVEMGQEYAELCFVPNCIMDPENWTEG